MLNNPNITDHDPRPGGEWRDYPANAVGVNNSFGGHEGAFTTTPAWTIGETIRIYVVGDRVTHIHLPDRPDHRPHDGWMFRHENKDGANIHGGNQTTSEWLTFQIGQFRLVGTDGRIHHNSPRLTDKDGFQGANTLTPRTPLPAPCFGPYNVVLIQGSTDYPSDCYIRYLESGEHILCRDGQYREIIWTDAKHIEVTKKNHPIRYMGQIYSPQHRILIGRSWVKAKFLADHGMAEYVEPRPATQWYGHILLAEHSEIVVMGGFAESLLPTERALSAMPPEMAQEIRDALQRHGLTPETYPGLTRPEVRRRDMAQIVEDAA